MFAEGMVVFERHACGSHINAEHWRDGGVSGDSDGFRSDLRGKDPLKAG